MSSVVFEQFLSDPLQAVSRRVASLRQSLARLRGEMPVAAPALAIEYRAGFFLDENSAQALDRGRGWRLGRMLLAVNDNGHARAFDADRQHEPAPRLRVVGN